MKTNMIELHCKGLIKYFDYKVLLSTIISTGVPLQLRNDNSFPSLPKKTYLYLKCINGQNFPSDSLKTLAIKVFK